MKHLWHRVTLRTSLCICCNFGSVDYFIFCDSRSCGGGGSYGCLSWATLKIMAWPLVNLDTQVETCSLGWLHHYWMRECEVSPFQTHHSWTTLQKQNDNVICNDQNPSALTALHSLPVNLRIKLKFIFFVPFSNDHLSLKQITSHSECRFF